MRFGGEKPQGRIMRPRLRLTAVLLALCALTALCASCGTVTYKSVGTCAGFEVYEDELRFVTLEYRQMMANEYGQDIWTDPEKAERYREELYRNVLNNLTVNYAVLDLARDVGYNQDDEDGKKLTSYIQVPETRDMTRVWWCLPTRLLLPCLFNPKLYIGIRYVP